MGKSKQLATMLSDAPAALDTLDELAAALGDDANFATTVTNSIATKLPITDPAIDMGTNKKIRFTGAIGEIGSVPGFQATNDANDGLRSMGLRGTTLRFATGDDERMRIEDNAVGIGTTSPAGKLHIQSGDAGTVTPSSQADDLVVEASTEGGITLMTPDDQSARIRFTSPSTESGDEGGADIFYRQNINKMIMGTTVSGGKLAFKSGAGVETIMLHNGYAGINFSDPASTGARLNVMGDAGSNAVFVKGNAGSGTSWGMGINAGSTSADASFRVYDKDGSNSYLYVVGDGKVGIGADGNMTAKFTVNKPATGHTTGYQEDIAQLYTTTATYTGRHYLNFFHDNQNRDASGDHTVWGMAFGYDTNTRGGIQYDHKGQERMTLWSSYGTMQFKLPATAVTTKRADQITENPALELKNNGNNLRPRQSGICLTLSGNQGLPGSGTWAWEKVDLDTIVYQNGNTSAWDSSNERYTCPESGLYLVTTSVQMENNGGATWRYLFPTINGSTSTSNGMNFADFVPQSQPNATYYHHTHSCILNCSSGDYIEWKAHGAGGGSTIKGGGETACAIYFLG
ncbi:MAG: hypothetical protein CMQ75_01975 [Gammaproteobacteria bacterium]|nr:hypothetical protein [Gammaproteobacteria bacterium]RPG99562.1 MAG: hypothetical protein CBC78_002175 [Candidatus Pelagibacter sp. TMED118]